MASCNLRTQIGAMTYALLKVEKVFPHSVLHASLNIATSLSLYFNGIFEQNFQVPVDQFVAADGWRLGMILRCLPPTDRVSWLQHNTSGAASADITIQLIQLPKLFEYQRMFVNDMHLLTKGAVRIEHRPSTKVSVM